MRFFSSEYEKEKAQHKKELVRNEFKVVGKYNAFVQKARHRR